LKNKHRFDFKSKIIVVVVVVVVVVLIIIKLINLKKNIIIIKEKQ
jgi:hypothetical protein